MQALYRRYRSRSLADVVGQETVVSALEQALATGKLHHAYLFSGARGTGKTSVARILAHAANDFAYELEQVHPDIIEIDAASNTGVDHIRELIERAALAPTAGRYKVYIIDEVHMLSRSAFNALLKTLEEPPASVIFILATTDPEKVPVTILSRVQHFKFKLAEPAVLAAHLRMVAEREKIKLDQAALEFLAESAGGSFRDALSLLEQAHAVCGKRTITGEALRKLFGAPSTDCINNLLAGFQAGDTPQVLALLEDLPNNHKSLVEGLARQILRQPDAATLALLDDLIEALKNPAIDPSLQIRLAFLRHLTPQVLNAPAPSPQPKQPGRPGAPLGSQSSPIHPASASEKAQPHSTPHDFSWQTALDELKQTDVGLWAVLSKRQIKIEQRSVTVYAEKELWANKLQAADNFAAISRLVAPRELIITTEPAPPSELATAVSAIIGIDASELKEVEVPDGI